MKIKCLNLLFLILAVTTANAQTEPVLSADNADELISENSLEGWQVPNTERWTVSGSTITGDTLGESLDQSEWIYTTEEYSDFVFSVEVKLNGNANSGIYFRSEIVDFTFRNEPTYEAPSGYEYDLAPNSNLNASIGDFFGRGGGFRFRADQTLVNSVYDPDGWNRITFRAEGDHIEYWMNGTLVNELTDTHPDRNASGLIGIQLHSDLVMSVEFRNAFVQDLNDEGSGNGGGSEDITFTPDPNKTYYIDAPVHNLRLAATGESEDAYTTSTTTTGADVEWKFVDRENGYWHIQRAGGGSKPRLRTSQEEEADMQPTSSRGTWTYFDFSEGAIEDTYFLTLPAVTTEFKRLQIDRGGVVKMVGDDRDGTWESFKITEVTTSSTQEDIRIEAEDFDAMSGIQTEASTESGENVGWINNGDWLRFDDVNLSGLSNIDVRVACAYTGGTIEVRTGSVTGALIGSMSISNTGGNQSWLTTNTSISNTSGIQDVYLVFTGGSGYLFNVNWIEFNNSSSASKDVTAPAEVTDVQIYPNPVSTTTTIKNAADAVLTLYDLNGTMVFTKVISSESEVINLDGLTAGIYYGEVIGATSVSMVKIVKN